MRYELLFTQHFTPRTIAESVLYELGAPLMVQTVADGGLDFLGLRKGYEYPKVEDPTSLKPANVGHPITDSRARADPAWPGWNTIIGQMRPPRLTPEQLQKLHQIEPLLRGAALSGDYEEAKRHALNIQNLLRASGHEMRLMRAKLWLFEAALGAGDLNIALLGLIGVRQKTSKGTRLQLEATALLAICYVRQKKLSLAEPLVREVLNSRNIRSESHRKHFLRQMVARFEEEGLLAGLGGHYPETLDPSEIQELAALIVRTRNEDEILCDLGSALPPQSVAFLLKIDAMAKRGLTRREVLYLPGEAQILEKAELGRTAFRSLKRVLYNSLCNRESEIYKAWFSSGLNCVLERKYLGLAVATAFLNLGLGIKALAVSAVALIMKFGIEVYCDRFKPDLVMDARTSR
jgi:hypothetical protein